MSKIVVVQSESIFIMFPFMPLAGMLSESCDLSYRDAFLIP